VRDPDVILAVNGHAGYRTKNPVVWQRLRPQRIHFEDGDLDSATSLSGRCFLKHAPTYSERDDDRDEGGANIKTALHIAHLNPLFSDASAWSRSLQARVPQMLILKDTTQDFSRRGAVYTIHFKYTIHSKALSSFLGLPYLAVLEFQRKKLKPV
jgi:hypothetical protein